MFLEIMKREGLFLHVFKRRRMCVCEGEWEKHGRYFFLFGFLREKRVVEAERGCGGHMFCDFFVCFWWFIRDRVF